MGSPLRSEVRATAVQQAVPSSDELVDYPDITFGDNSYLSAGTQLPPLPVAPIESTQSQSSGVSQGAQQTQDYPAAQSLAVTTFDATCGQSDIVGAVVRMLPGTGSVQTATPDVNLPAIGVITAKSSATNCTVQRYGYVKNIFTGLTPGALYFLGPSGSLTTPPFGDAVQFVQQIGQASSATVLYLQPLGTTYYRSAT